MFKMIVLPRRIAATSACITLCLALLGCEKKAPSPEASKADQDTAPAIDIEQEKEMAKVAPKAAPKHLQLSPLEVSYSPVPGQNPAWMPKPEVIKDHFSSALKNSTHLKPSGTDQTIAGTLQYSSVSIANPNEAKQLAIAVSIDLHKTPHNWTNARMEQMQIVEQPPEDQQKVTILKELTQKLAQSIDQRQAIAAADMTGMLDAITASKEPSPHTVMDVIARIRAHKDALSEAQKTHAIDVLKTQSKQDDAQLIPPIMAALLELNLPKEELGSLVLDAATRASQRNDTQLQVYLITFMGDHPSEVTLAYLETVASAHPNKLIQKIATESFERSKKSTP